MHPVLGQVADVLVTRGKGDYGFGSAYRCGRTLVLTAGHVVEDAADGAPIEVRLALVAGRPATVEARVVWRGRSADLALLRISGPLPPVTPPRLGRLRPEPARRVPFVTVGYPAFNTRPAASARPVLESLQVDGAIARSPTTRPAFWSSGARDGRRPWARGGAGSPGRRCSPTTRRRRHGRPLPVRRVRPRSRREAARRRGPRNPTSGITPSASPTS
jgi:hypothetical protein